MWESVDGCSAVCSERGGCLYLALRELPLTDNFIAADTKGDSNVQRVLDPIARDSHYGIASLKKVHLDAVPFVA